MENKGGRELKVHYLVISRSCADLYEEIARLFADHPDIKVIVDRRRGPTRMKEIPKAKGRRSRKAFKLIDGEPDERLGS